MSSISRPYLRTHRWRQLTVKLKKERQWVCYLCGIPIPNDVPPRSRWSCSVDHVVSIAEGGDPFDEANCALAHLACNARKAAREPIASSSTPRQSIVPPPGRPGVTPKPAAPLRFTRRW
ncbi:HNH endonuclease [Rhodococcus sp. T7]|uniref:HNH endonuclease n=1 Tax=Rhodococcus sp. T7 TaxID=627444 RepID=UPI00135C82D9|nr:HNH endonuclease [Rhodococcus sp. T7]